jgi:hypothetical protein
MAVGAEITGSVNAGGYFAGADNPFGPGTVGRWQVIWFVLASLWLFTVWRIVEGY